MLLQNLFSRPIFLLLLAIFFSSPHIAKAQNPSILTEFERNIIQLLQKVQPSVVTIKAKFDYNMVGTGEKSLLDFKSGEKQPIEMTNVGSGIIYDSSFIITKTSVVQGSKSIEVIFSDSTKADGELIGSDSEWGLAVVKIKKNNGRPAQLGRSQDVRAGCWVMLVGNSLGVSPAMSWGTVNCIRNDGIVQISANVPAGNAGGPIFDTRGNLVAVLAALYDPTPNEMQFGASFGANETILAYPINEVINRVEKMIKQSSNGRAWIGISVNDWPGITGGAHINHIEPGSPAERAKLRVGDIVTGLNGNHLRTTAQFAKFIENKNPGDVLQLKVLRGNGNKMFMLTVGKLKPQPGANDLQNRNLPFTITDPGGTYTIDMSPEGSSSELKQADKEWIKMRINNLEKEIHQLKNMMKNYK
ncbi:MAG: PDZ domain-containing protein [Actinobacteria bacterium]|nr:PDZ domain-containing protein [Actinomycetota bacterium]